MREEDKKWIKWIILAVFGGGLIGSCFKQVLVKVLPKSLALIPCLCMPAAIVIGLLIVLYFYQKEKDDVMQ